VRLEKASYPAGADFTLPLDPETKLSVYTGEFQIKARIVATTGNHLVEARLRYQACRSERLHAAEDDYRADRRDWKIAGNREQGSGNRE